MGRPLLRQRPVRGRGAWDNTARVWEVDSKRLIYTFPAHVSDTWAVAFSPDGQLIASGGGDHKVKVWDMATGILVQDVSGELHTGEVENIAFSPDGKTLASVSRDGTLRTWNLPGTTERISAYVKQGMSEWSKQGEFEKSDEYQKRQERKDRQLADLTRGCQEKIVNSYGNTANWQPFTIAQYNADSESFTLHSRLFGDKMRLHVPPREAERVRANFSQMRYGNPTFDIDDDQVILKNVSVLIPVDGTTKTFTIGR
ncbi:WD40 repeat domain-containing protein [Spirosoma rhododendri]|uniref:WD40 repeat domain-containing protein n=1 Tax=Spirosoma rhododendri TaxID=2728024 RepID=A0A7L5DS21_9BACT|nr:PD40 domain-containing protein [Spirosoma rhododendri]QJD80043.1 hypothetical protein HH216_17700 [Spirosoma rhododendri]